MRATTYGLQSGDIVSCELYRQGTREFADAGMPCQQGGQRSVSGSSSESGPVIPSDCYRQMRRHVTNKRYGGRGIRVCDRWREAGDKGLDNLIDDIGLPKKDREVA